MGSGSELIYFNVFLMGVGFLVAIIGITSMRFSSNGSHEWKPVHTMRTKKLIDGSRSSGFLMSRTVNGEKQYRQMTQSEAEDAVIDRW